MPTPDTPASCGHSEVRWLIALVAVVAAGLLAYSQVATLDWDEGFHLVAASLIAAGKRPYIDFCFPQPALHAWWNALWLSLAGSGWRIPQFIAALLTCSAIALTAGFVYRRFPSAGFAAALLAGLNPIVFEFGTKAQAYGAGTFLTVAAFCTAIAPQQILRAALSGCLAGAAASCTLLTAPACPVLLAWHCWHRRWINAAAFIAGTIVVTLPIFTSLIQAPHQTWFNLVSYHALYRSAGWTGATEHDLQTLTSWVDSAPALLLTLFTLAGLWFVHKSPAAKAEVYLAAIMAAALGLEAAIAHPTFPQYFIFVVPFLAIPAALGFCDVISRWRMPQRWAIPGLAVLLLLSLANSLVEFADDNNTWTNMDRLARQIEQVTPPNALILADPPVYFALHQAPPPGMEFPASHAVELPPPAAASLHIVPQSVLVRRVHAGEFATVETCKGNEPELEALELPKLYSQSSSVGDCQVYWAFK